MAKKSKARNKAVKAQQVPPEPLPPLHAVIGRPPKAPLRARELRGDLILEVPGALAAAECAALVRWAERRGFEECVQRGRPGYAVRRNGRIAEECERTAEKLWQRLGALAPPLPGLVAVGMSPNVRLYRYVRGQRFGRHIDETVDLGNGRFTHYTVLLYLSDDVEGGETKFYHDSGRLDCSVRPRTGLALLHGHGERCAEHEGAEVRRGTKYLLRTDVVYERAAA